MSTDLFLIVILAALLHAVWNSLVKGGHDKALNMSGVVIGHVPIAILCLCFVPLPDLTSWPYLIGGLLLHAGYQWLLLSAYRMGDFTQVYPIARGTAPLIVAIVSIAFLGVVLQALEQLAILLIVLGIISLSLARQDNGRRNNRAAWFAFLTGCFIAAYSLNDGIGARISQSPIGFYACLGIGNAIVWAIFMAIKHPQSLKQLPRTGKRVFFIGGSASFIAYALVMYAFTQAPIALVTALRETSIIFALLIGVFFLKEKTNLIKTLSIAITLAGAILVRFAK